MMAVVGQWLKESLFLHLISGSGGSNGSYCPQERVAIGPNYPGWTSQEGLEEVAYSCAGED